MNTALIKQTDAAKSLLASFKPVLTDYATRDYNQDSFLKSALMSFMESPELMKCLTTDAGKASIFHALRYAATTGLSLNPMEGKACLIAYNGKVEYQVMKAGMIELALASGKVEFITSDIVYEGDEFDLEKTPKGDDYKFKPALSDRGQIKGFFAALVMTDGVCHVKWIDRANMEEHRTRYGKGASNQNSAWVKSFDGMGIKTVLKALLRGVVISPDLSSAVVADDIFEAGEVIDITPEPETPGTDAEDVKEALQPQTEDQGPPEGEQGDATDGRDLF